MQEHPLVREEPSAEGLWEVSASRTMINYAALVPAGQAVPSSEPPVFDSVAALSAGHQDAESVDKISHLALPFLRP